MFKKKIIEKIKENIPDADIKIHMENDKHFSSIIISDLFINKNIIDRQKMIYKIIGKYIKSKQIHAFSFKTYTKNEWIGKT